MCCACVDLISLNFACGLHVAERVLLPFYGRVLAIATPTQFVFTNKNQSCRNLSCDPQVTMSTITAMGVVWLTNIGVQV